MLFFVGMKAVLFVYANILGHMWLVSKKLVPMCGIRIPLLANNVLSWLD